MRRRPVLLAVLSIAAFLACTEPVFSQVITAQAQLNGSVRDQSGSAIVKAAITLRDVDTNYVYTATADVAGYYIFTNLPPGNYQLGAEYTGFGKYTQTGIVLRVAQVATIDITLKVAAAGEKIEVNSEAPIIEPTRTEISQVIDTQQIQNLPISGRLFTDFALLTPGVATGRTSLQSTFTDPSVTRISFGGQRDLNNAVTVDGADNINTATGSQRATPSQEAVSEFRVVNNSFAAEYGRALGGIVNIVTKSGTNDYHGSIYDYLQNDVTNATSLLTIATIPRSALPQNVLRQNQFGATLGGPIQKDKTFFFMSSEGQRRGESPTYPPLLVSELTLINTAKTLMGIAPENLNLLKTKHHDYGIVKVDHQFNDKYRISLRYNIEDARDLNALVGNTLDGGGIGTPSGGRNISIRDQSLVVNLNTQLKPNLINSTLVQWARRHYNFPGATGQPDLSLPNQLEFGHNFGVLDAIYESRGQFSDSLAWVKGNHVAKFGVDINYIRDSVIWPGFTPTRIILPGINCLVDFANFVNPAPTAANQLASDFAQGPCPVASFPFCPPAGTIGANPNDALNGDPATFWAAPIGTGAGASVNGTIPPPINTNWQNAFRPDQRQNFYYALYHSYFGFFAQDQWRVTPKLTVNYGLRYEFETGLGNV